jgi:hypothetical protein
MTETRASRLKLPQAGQTFEFCSEVKGFGVRCTATTRSYIVQPRYNGQKLRLNLGTVGVTPFEGPPQAPGARDLAIPRLPQPAGRRPPRRHRPAQAADGALADVWAAYCEAGHPKLKGTAHKRRPRSGKIPTASTAIWPTNSARPPSRISTRHASR